MQPTSNVVLVVMNSEITQKLYEFIRARPLAVIATADKAGKPEAALINIAVTPDLEIVFETTSATRKFANLENNSEIALVVGWEGEQTLQYDGIVDQPEGVALDRLRSLYISRFPEKDSHQYWPGNSYFRVRPFWIRFSDYDPPRRIEEYRFPVPQVAVSPTHSLWQTLLGLEQRQHN
jgi:uncharacterized protein YhbP (UPF0306 family)